MEQKNIKQLLIITSREKQAIDQPGGQIKVVPIYEWLLNN